MWRSMVWSQALNEVVGQKKKLAKPGRWSWEMRSWNLRIGDSGGNVRTAWVAMWMLEICWAYIRRNPIKQWLTAYQLGPPQVEWVEVNCWLTVSNYHLLVVATQLWQNFELHEVWTDYKRAPVGLRDSAGVLSSFICRADPRMKSHLC